MAFNLRACLATLFGKESAKPVETERPVDPILHLQSNQHYPDDYDDDHGDFLLRMGRVKTEAAIDKEREAFLKRKF